MEDLKITFTIPANIGADLIEAFAKKYWYNEQINKDGVLIPNPESKQQFAKKQVRKYLEGVYVAYKIAYLEDERKQVIELAKTEAGSITSD